MPVSPSKCIQKRACYTLEKREKSKTKKKRLKASVKTENQKKTGETDSSAWAGAGPVLFLGPHQLAVGAGERRGTKKVAL